MAKGIIHTEMIPVCTVTGDPGCLGYPAWIDHEPVDCNFQPFPFQFCDCGGNDVYGEMWHEANCPAAEQSSAQRDMWARKIMDAVPADARPA